MVSHMTIYRVKKGEKQLIELTTLLLYSDYSSYIDSSVCITKTTNVNMQ